MSALWALGHITLTAGHPEPASESPRLFSQLPFHPTSPAHEGSAPTHGLPDTEGRGDWTQDCPSDRPQHG